VAPLDNKLGRLIERQVDGRRQRGVLAAVQSSDGRVEAAAAAGWADAAESIPLTTRSPYFLASITKIYTAVVALQLSREGKLDLEVHIGEYLPSALVEGIHVIGEADHIGAITVEHLLRQTSGLPDYFAGKAKGGASLVEELNTGRDRAVPIEDVVAVARTLPPIFPPGADGGTKAHYSDTNYALLGAVIEAVTSASLSKSFDERIFQPLGLEATRLFDHRRQQPRPAMIWHKDTPLDLPLAMSSFKADGAMVATLADSVAFLRGVFEGKLLTDDELGFMTNPWNRIFFPVEYGAGLMRFNLPKWLSPFRNPGELIGHSGSTGSFAFYSPERDLFVVGSVNQSDKPSRPFRLIPRILDLAR